MNAANIVQTEINRVLAAATVVFGHKASLETLSDKARTLNATLETREEIDYLITAVSAPHSANLGMVVNIADNLVDKMEMNRFGVVLGFGWLEGLAANLTESAKKLVGWSVSVALTVLASLIVFNVGLSKVPAMEFWTYALSLVVMIGTAAVTAAWACTVDFDNRGKKAGVMLGYAYAVFYAYILYRCDLNGFNFNYPIFGNSWMIVWATIAPIVAPIGILFWNWLPEDSGARIKNEAPAVNPYFNHEDEKMGKIHTSLDSRLTDTDYR